MMVESFASDGTNTPPLLPQGDSDEKRSFRPGDGKTRLIGDFDDAESNAERPVVHAQIIHGTRYFTTPFPPTYVVISEAALHEIEQNIGRSMQAMTEAIMTSFAPAMRATMEQVDQFIERPEMQELLRQDKAEQAARRAHDPKQQARDRSKADVQAKRHEQRSGKTQQPRQRARRGRR